MAATSGAGGASGLTARHQILVIEDEEDVRKTIKDALLANDLVVVEAAGREEALNLLAERNFDLVLLDLILAGWDATELLGDIARGRKIAVMVITGWADPIKEVVLFGIGAVDVIRKPFHPNVLEARVRHQLQRAARPQPSPQDARTRERELLEFGDLVLDHAGREVRRGGGEIIELTSLEYRLLHLFVTRPQRVLSRDDIMTTLKGHEWNPNDRAIDVLVSKLRSKIDSAGMPSLIKTQRGEGYALNAQVRTRRE